MSRLTTQYLCRILGGCFIVLLAFSIFSEWENAQPRPLSGDEIFPLLEDSTVRTSAHSDVDIVVASQQRDDTKWLEIDFPAWNHHIYVTDDPQASRRVPTNKGREAMVYLTYIIENYDRLPSIVIFHHANRYQWHNDDPLYDGKRVLDRLNVSYIEEEGYTNLRCCWTLGCPTEIRPYVEDAEKPSAAEIGDKDPRAGWYYKEAFEALFPGEAVPTEVGAPCCAQFAAAGWKIRQRPRRDYERYRQWLLDTELVDHVSGRILEYSWHIIFGKEPVACPNASQCYCKLYGLCSLVCEEEGVCKSQYKLPTYSSMPAGWPDYGWNGEWQNATEM